LVQEFSIRKLIGARVMGTKTVEHRDQDDGNDQP